MGDGRWVDRRIRQGTCIGMYVYVPIRLHEVSFTVGPKDTGKDRDKGYMEVPGSRVKDHSTYYHLKGYLKT